MFQKQQQMIEYASNPSNHYCLSIVSKKDFVRKNLLKQIIKNKSGNFETTNIFGEKIQLQPLELVKMKSTTETYVKVYDRKDHKNYLLNSTDLISLYNQQSLFDSTCKLFDHLSQNEIIFSLWNLEPVELDNSNESRSNNNSPLKVQKSKANPVYWKVWNDLVIDKNEIEYNDINSNNNEQEVYNYLTDQYEKLRFDKATMNNIDNNNNAVIPIEVNNEIHFIYKNDYKQTLLSSSNNWIVNYTTISGNQIRLPKENVKPFTLQKQLPLQQQLEVNLTEKTTEIKHRKLNIKRAIFKIISDEY